MIVIVADLLILTLIYFLLAKPNSFLFYLIMIKPFIDLTVNVTPFYGFNALEVSGILVFIYASIYYFKELGKEQSFNQGWIWLFLLINSFSFLWAFLEGQQNILAGIRLIAQLYGSFFIYFLAFKYLLSSFEKRLKIYKMIWITILITGLINILSYLTGYYSTDITRGIVRVGGIYGDPGTPSFLSVLAIYFGTLYFQLSKKLKKYEKILYIGTWMYMAYTMYLTLTKSAVLMLIVFILMWWGIKRNKMFIIAPLLIASLYFVYKDISVVQTRMEYEMEFLRNPTEKTAISVGTGRVGVWMKLIDKFDAEYTLFQKAFGTSKNYAAHNQFIAYLMQIGIVGLAVFVFIVFRYYLRLIQLYRKTKNDEIFAAITILSCFISLSISGHPFGWTTILWYLMIMLGLSNIRRMNTLLPARVVSS